MRKNIRKGLCLFLSVLLVLCGMHTVALADTTTEAITDTAQQEETAEEDLVIPNFMGYATLNNTACKEIKSYTGLNLEIILTDSADPTKTFTVPLKYDKDMEMYSAEAYLEQAFVPGMIEDILENQKATMKKYGLDEESLQAEDTDTDSLEWLSDVNLEDLSKLLVEGIFDGYTVTLNGLGEDAHFKAKLFDGGVQTGADHLALFELMLVSFGPEDGFAEDEKPTGYVDLLNYIAKSDPEAGYESYEDALRESEIFGDDELNVLIALMEKEDAYLLAAQEGNFPNQLQITMTLLCGCPVMVEYEIYHQYMVEKDGELMEIEVVQEGNNGESDMAYLEGEEGQVIRARDFVKETYEGANKEYAGKTFTFTGSYDSMALWEVSTDWSAYALEEYTLSDSYDYFGLVLSYVLKEEPIEEPIEEPNVEQVEEKKVELKKTKVESKKDITVTKTEAVAVEQESEEAPLTGDSTQMIIYVTLLLTAAGTAVGQLIIKGRHNKVKEK